ncbi:PREDICTED: elongation of very long chain fatty acids protein 7-like [Papilio xuthus]|uniref:Elongation of very long chain fatty acids protein n=1 Tax=Papilio xuthus TaxID=66420 RepID=A0AAJ6ZR38_PAPXU|nr:PREDICTED: elongation of very long chain fatty acids protein 7-like [Papilio xuthus]
MNSSGALGLRIPEWNLNKSQYDEVDSLPLIASIGPVLTILATYLVFVLKIGPALMTKREPFKLNTTLLLYNGIQVIISVYLVQRYLMNILNFGLLPKKCYIQDVEHRNNILIGIWLYFAAKVTELLDTIFFVLRKKDNQVTFLHLYHHSIMMIGTWCYIKYWPSHTLIFIGFLNSLVHVFMYTYYGLSALGPNVAKYLFWKKYMTKFQLVQFVCIIIQYVFAVRNSECPPAKGVATFVACNTGFFLVLFLNFYRHSYNRKLKKTSNSVCQTINKLEETKDKNM